MFEKILYPTDLSNVSKKAIDKEEVMKKLVFIAALFAIIFSCILSSAQALPAEQKKIIPDAVCPPFFLKDGAGNIINPVTGSNTDKPYSPKQTCGTSGCHDYQKITEGYHFTQGARENPTAAQAERIQWALTPGNYGGNWCSPAPLYRFLSPKENSSPKTMDMTSFSFITAGCGNCHPGGGSAEVDRNGNRYDEFMAEKGYTAGGDNDFDGDYYQAYWDKSGVLEADCMICHQPGYNYSERKQQLQKLNFRWAPTAASGWASVTGAIKDNTPVKVAYNMSLFDADGKISPIIVREPRNNACLECHGEPGWKKRGANFSVRTDVHSRAGLKCVDCHPAGSKALDSRINEREMHQIAKGDDPGGLVRNDLDNTMNDCGYCHSNGHLGAPIAKHTWLPPLHLDRIACQTCHIPQRAVKSAQFQAGDVFNPGTKIPSKGKYLWVYYGPDMQYYNHYGNMEMMGYDDKPTDPFKPVLARYKEKIYPVNRIHSAWPGIETKGKPGLMQPLMSDIYKMWATHFKDPTQYPELAEIKDDNNDGVIEVNRPAEIDALISAVTKMLKSAGDSMGGRRVVWAMDDRVYRSGTEFYTIPKEKWEASPYANVHKYNHDIYPAKSALGINGCGDCHSFDASFFFADVVQYPFDANGRSITIPQTHLLDVSAFEANAGIWRESLLKKISPWLFVIVIGFMLIHLTICGTCNEARRKPGAEEKLICRLKLHERLTHCLTMISFLILGLTGILFLFNAETITGPWARELHAWTGWFFLAGLIAIFIIWIKNMGFEPGDKIWMRAFGGYFRKDKNLPAGKFNAGQKIFFWVIIIMGLITGISGVILFFLRENVEANLSLIYTIHDFAAVIMLLFVIMHIYLGLIINPESIKSVFGGNVSENWLKEHHPNID